MALSQCSDYAFKNRLGSSNCLQYNEDSYRLATITLNSLLVSTVLLSSSSASSYGILSNKIHGIYTKQIMDGVAIVCFCPVNVNRLFKKKLRSSTPDRLVILGFFMYTDVELRNRIYRSERRPYKPVSIGRNGDLKPVSIAENNC